MKRILLILSTAALLIFCSSFSAGMAEKKKKNVEDITGTWKLEAYRHNISANSFTTRSEDVPELKFINGKNFCWISYDAKTRKVLTSAGGTYTLEGDTYTEAIDYGLGMDAYLGTKSEFKIRIEGDTMFISGSLSTGQRIEQVWQRVK